MNKFKHLVIMFVAFLIIGVPNIKAAVISGDSNYYTLDHTDNVKTIKLLKDIPASEFNSIFNTEFTDLTAEEEIVIDGDGHKITLDSTTASAMIDLGGTKTKGDLATYSATTKTWTTTNEGEYGFDGKITFKHIFFVGSTTTTKKVMLVYINLPHADITFQSCLFEKYQKAAIWAANFRKMTVDDSNFDGSYITVSEGTGASDLYSKSSEHISLCLGDEFAAKPFNSYRVESISITNNVFNDIEQVSENGTSAIKLKIKNKTVVTDVGNITIKNNKFENNMVDVVVGEKNPETALPVENPTTYDESANLDINFEKNTSTNSGGLKIQSVYNIATVPTEADRTAYIANTITSPVLFNFVSKLYLVKNIDKSLTIEDTTDLKTSLPAIKATEQSSVLKIEGTNYDITFAASDIKDNLSNTVTDLSLNISTTIPNELKDKAKEGSIIISSTVTGELPVSKLTVNTKVPEFANKKVELHYYNEETEKLELLGTYQADAKGNIAIKLTHFSTYILTPLASNLNPETSDGIMNILLLTIISVIGITGSVLLLKKQKKFN